MNKFRMAIALVFLLVPASHAQNTITTVAGGVPNNINALSVGFGLGGGPAGDSSGNIYIADSFHNVIYKISSAGILTTVAGIGTGSGGFSGDGGPATSAELNIPKGMLFSTPSGIFVDTAGNIFIADTLNNRIREIVLSTGKIQTVAGGGSNGLGDGGPATSAELNEPSGVFVDTAGNIFIADSSNNRIREVVASTGKIQTVAGNGTAGFSGDGGPATSAEFFIAEGIFVDTAGNIFIADFGNERIRKVVASTGKIQTVAGSGTEGFSGDGGPATSAELNGPSGVFVDTAGNIFIADTGNNRIREIVLSTGKIQTVAGGGSNGLGDGGPATSAELDPLGVFVDTAGNIFVGDGSNRVREVANSTGIIQSIAGNGTEFSGDGVPATNTELDFPIGVFADGLGNIFIADADNDRIREVVASTGKIQTVAGNGTAGFSGDGGAATTAELFFPQGVFVDTAGNIFIADSNNNRIREVVASTGKIQTVAGNGTAGFSGDGGPATSAELFYPQGIFVDTAGNIFIADSSNNRIRKVVASTGKIQTVAGSGTEGFSGDGGPATSAELNGPSGVFVDTAGNIFIADTGNNRIREIVLSTGKIQTVAGGGSNGLGDGGPATSAELDPLGVFVDTAGNIFVGDGSNRVREVVASTGKIQTVAGSGTEGFSGDGGPATSAELDIPIAIWGDNAGNLSIADTHNSRIRMVAGLTSVPASTLSPLDTFTGAQPAQTATLTNSGAAPLLISSIAITGTNPADFTFGSPTTCPMSGGPLAAGESCTLTIALSSSVINMGSTSGTVSGSATLIITHDAAVGTPTPTPAVAAIANGQFQQTILMAVDYAAPVLSFSPASVTFTTANVAQTLTLKNNGDTPLSITSITPPAGFILGAGTSNGCTPPSPSVAARLTLSGNGTCSLNVTFTGSGGSSSGLLVFTDDAFSSTGKQTVALTGFALIVTNGPSFTISNSAPSPSTTANLEVLGPSTVTYSILCVVAPAGLIITCPTTPVASNTTFSAVISIPSCATEPVFLPKPTGWPLSALIGLVLSLLLFIRGGRMDLRRVVYASVAIAVVCFAGLLSSCSTGKTSSAGCVASVTTQNFQAIITATPVMNSSVPTVTTVPPIPITVTK